jgi:hypothetical protein
MRRNLSSAVLKLLSEGLPSPDEQHTMLEAGAVIEENEDISTSEAHTTYVHYAIDPKTASPIQVRVSPEFSRNRFSASTCLEFTLRLLCHM